MRQVGRDRMLVDRMQPTIAHVITESTPFGGAQRNTLLTLQGLRRDGYPVELICGPGGPLIERAAALDVPVHVVEDLVRPIMPVKDCRTLIQLYKLFRSRRYHIVHTHSTKAGFLGRLAAWWAGVPIIIHTIHGYPFEMHRGWRASLYTALERCIGSVTDSMICVGEIIRQDVAAWKWGGPEKLVTIYSGIDFSSYVARCTAVEIKQALGITGAWPIVGSIGHLVEAKAQHYLIDAIALLKNKFPQIKLLLVGEGRLRPRLESQIQERGLGAHVELLGERDDIADLLNAFDIYAMSSRYEGVGRALTEAMYWGLPIVVTSVNGVKELIVHGETGLLVPPHDSRALAACIDRLASTPELGKRLGANARHKAQELMDSERMIKAIEDLYSKLVWSAPSPQRRRLPKALRRG